MKIVAGARFWVGQAGGLVMVAGGCVVITQAIWISYGVIMRYVFREPDAIVTEATALLLFPVAFSGLVYAMQTGAYPRVTVLVDKLRPPTRKRLEIFNFWLMAAVAGFFTVAATQAAWRDFHSGAASEILLWPRYLFWVPSAFSLFLFSLYAALSGVEMVFKEKITKKV